MDVETIVHQSSADAIISAMWRVCIEHGGDGISIDPFCDQWWHIIVVCDHGEFHAVSNGPTDLSRGLARIYIQFKEAHG